MTIDEFEALLLRHGGDPDRWPADRRSKALALVTGDPRALTLLEEVRRLDGDLIEATAIEPLTTAELGTLLRLPGTRSTRRSAVGSATTWAVGSVAPRIAAIVGTGGLAAAGFVLGFVRTGIPSEDPATLLIGLADAGHLLWIMM